MSVGLFDMDMATYTHVPFNLELMKLSSYYKSKKEIVKMSKFLNLDMYTKVFLRKDYDDGNYPKEIYTSKNLLYGGKAFSGETYVPLDEEIELSYPDKYIYTTYEKNFSDDVTHSAAFKTMMNAEHLRISLDGKTIWNKYKKPVKIRPKTQAIFLHDYDLNKIEGSIEAIQELMSETEDNVPFRYIGMKFPIQVNNGEDLLKWLVFKPMRLYYSLQYNGIIDDEVFVEFIERQRGTSISRQLDYIVTNGQTSENDFILNGLPKIFKQALFSQMNRVRISLKYEDDFFTDKRWCRVIELFNAYAHHEINYYKKEILKPGFRDFSTTNTLFQFASSFKEKRILGYPFTKDEVREVFRFVKENHYELFKMFYEVTDVGLKGGKLVDETIRY